MLLPLLALSPLALPQTTWFVDDDATPPGTGTAQDPYASIQFAIDAPTTVDGDEIRVLPGDYPEDLLIDSKAIDLRGDTSSGPVRVVKASAATRSLTIRSVAAPGVHVAGIEFAQDDVSLEGGGVLVESSVAVLEDVRITEHVARALSANDPAGSGLLVKDNSVVFVTGSTISECGNEVRGAGVGVFASDVTLVDCRIERCGEYGTSPSRSPQEGGGAYLGSGSLMLRGCDLVRNNASRGSGVYVGGGQCFVEDCRFKSNGDPSFASEGGGIAGVADVRSSLFAGNSSSRGGGAFGPSTFTDCVFDANIGAGPTYAPAIWGSDSGARASLVRCTVKNHRGTTFGGPGTALYRCNLTDCRVENNWCDSEGTSALMAGGLTDGSATGTVFAHNRGTMLWPPTFGSPVVQGGAVSNSTLDRCILYGNVAVGDSSSNLASRGGGAHGSTLVNCTLIGNEADGTGGAASDCSLVSCIVWDCGPSPLADPTRVDWCCVEGGAPGTGNISVDPELFGFVASDFMRPRPGSPCVDAGDPAALDPNGTRTDIGALPFDPQYQPAPSTYCLSFASFPVACDPSLVASVNPSLSGGWPVRIEGIDPNTFSVAVVASGAQLPGSRFPSSIGEKLCIGGTLRRSGAARSVGTESCGSVADLLFTPRALQGIGAVVGQSVYAQGVFRTPGSLPFGITRALQAIVLP